MHRQLEPIWDAIDDEQFGHALQLIEKTQKRYRTPNLTLLGLQGLCLARNNRLEEALAICDRLRKDAPEDKNTYQTIHDILKVCSDQQASDYLTSTMASGYALIKSEFMGRLWFMESVRAGDLAAQRKAAMELQKGFLSRHYFYLVLISMRLLYQSGSDSKDRTLLGMLMYRMISKAAENTAETQSSSLSGPSIDNIEEFYLYLDILLLLDKPQEALNALSGPHGVRFAGNHDLLLLRLDLLDKIGNHELRVQIARNALEVGGDDWLIMKALIDSGHVGPHAVQYEDFCSLVKCSGSRKPSRNALLARVYLVSKSPHEVSLLDTLKVYAQEYGDKLTTYEDLAPYLPRLSSEQQKTFLDHVMNLSMDSVAHQTVTFTNYIKFNILLNYNHVGSEGLLALVPSMLHRYVTALQHASGLKPTDNQYGDDLILLAAQITSAASHQNTITTSKLLAIVMLQQAMSNSKHNYQIRLCLISLYRQIGAWSLANANYRALHIKHIQHDTLSFLLLEKASYEYCSTLQISCLRESQSIYQSSKRETPDAICQAYENRTYSKVPEFLEMQKRLDRSLWQFEAQASIWSLEILLDKFSYPQQIDFAIVDGHLYENKNRRVKLDVFETTKPLQTDHVANESDVQALKQSYHKIQLLQAIVINKSVDNHVQIQQQEQTDDSVYDLVRSLYKVKFESENVSAAKARLEEQINSIKIPEVIKTSDLDSDVLHDLGRTVESLKMFSISSPHIKADLHAMKRKVLDLNKQMKQTLEKLRLDIIESEVSIIAPEGLVMEASFIAKVIENVKISRRESVTCLLGIVKGIK